MRAILIALMLCVGMACAGEVSVDDAVGGDAQALDQADLGPGRAVKAGAQDGQHSQQARVRVGFHRKVRDKGRAEGGRPGGE